MSQLTNSNASYPHDDGWHYLADRDEKHEANYVEWKYFNFTQKDLSGYIVYYILDPEKKTNLSGGRLIVRVIKDGISYGLIKKTDINQIELDSVSASMHMGGARITEIDTYHYELACIGEDISFNLNFKQKSPSIEAFQNVNPGFMPWEKMNWLIKMPRAEVVGEIKIGKENFHIDGLGYSDTNWGEMVPFFSRYEWGQYNEKSFSLVFGIVYGLKEIKSTYFYLVVGEHLIKLENTKVEAEHTEWKEDEIIGIKIPIKSTFSAKNEEYEIKFSTKLIYHDSPGMKVHPLLPNVVVSEQIVEFEGAVFKDGKVLHKFEGKGFEEWSGKTWKEVTVAF